MYTGSCLCAGVQFRIDQEIEPIQVCHCSQCRKAHGTPFATNAPVASASFSLTQGKDLLREYESSPGKTRYFCGRCGSPIYSRKDTLPEVVRIRAGLINEPIKIKPAAHFHVASKCNWWPITDDLPQFPEAYVPKR